jgi:hypothetical protein
MERMTTKRQFDYYATYEIEGMDHVRELVPHADDLNWLFVGTSGVHGSYTTCDEALNDYEDEGEAFLTILVVQPRMVRTFYGHLEVTQDDIEWLREREAETVRAIANRSATGEADNANG